MGDKGEKGDPGNDTCNKPVVDFSGTQIGTVSCS